MYFQLNWLPMTFEIPDAWLAHVELAGFNPPAVSFRSARDAIAIGIEEVQPPVRLPTVEHDFNGFDRQRFLAVLSGMIQDLELPPIILRRLPSPEFEELGTPNPYKYRVYDGFHRYYASVAAGFSHVSSEVV
jgi:hypothetical protein